jgi:tellurite resistance protein TehA-like permease
MRELGSALAGAARRTVPGSFSMVMATGIVAAALRQDEVPLAADVVLAIAAAAFALLAAASGWRCAALPTAVRADLTSPARAFAAFTFPAGCGVLGLGLATVGLLAAGTVLAAAGAAAWLTLTALIPARMATSRRARPVTADINGTWYLWAVGTQSLAIMAAFLQAGGLLAARPAAAVALTAWLAGLIIYLLTTGLVAVRLVRIGVGPHGARAAYWVGMGAASISVLAAAHILRIVGAPAVAAGRPGITATAIVLWVVATCLIPVLAAATAASWLRSRPRPRYQASAWMVVFPLGMYSTASQQLGVTAGQPLIRLVGEGFTWPAAAAWLAVVAALVATPFTRAGGRPRAAAGQREPSASGQRERNVARPPSGQPEFRAIRKYQAPLDATFVRELVPTWALRWPWVVAVWDGGGGSELECA